MNAPAFMNGGDGGGEEREPFAAFLSDEPSTEALATVIEERGWDTSRIQSGGIANAVRSLALMASPYILVIDLSQSQDALGDISALAEVCEPGTIVIALGEVNDVNLYRELLAAGVFDYLVKPVSTDVLRTSLSHAEEALQTEPEPVAQESQPGRFVSFIGLRGGAGTSTLAINSAWLMANEMDLKVGYLDLDVNFGTSALAFDLEPGRGLADALENPGRVDSLFIERAMLKQSENLSILGAEAPLSEAFMPDPAALTHLIDEMRQHFDCVVMEIPRHLVGHYPFLLAESAEIALVADMTLPAVRDALRVQGFLQEVAPKAKVTLVANKVGSQLEVSQKDFETAVERKIDWAIPLDAKVAMGAAKSAKMMAQVASSSKCVSTLRNMVRDLAGVETPAKKSSIFSSLFGAGSKSQGKKTGQKKGKQKAEA